MLVLPSSHTFCDTLHVSATITYQTTAMPASHARVSRVHVITGHIQGPCCFVQVKTPLVL